MAGIRKAGALIATAALTLPLWLASCTPGAAPSAGSGIPAAVTAVEATEPGTVPVPIPLPQPQPPPPPVSAPVEAAAPPSQRSPTSSGSAETPQTGSSTAPVPGPGLVPGATLSVPRPSPTPVASVLPPARPYADPSTAPPGAGTRPVTAYYVLLDDGGAGGVRFGCNDSLASVRRSVAGSTEPLPAAMNSLLDGSAEPAPGLYNSLAASALTFLSGTFDGTTVTVYLSGTLRPGGVCDIPRVEAPLTQTAVASVGAIRAEVYVNGVGLAEALSLR